MPKHQTKLYWLILALVFGVFVVALGGGLFNQQEIWYLQWQHLAFQDLCHQIPERSFWLNGQPMAVCSRCLGIYGGFALGWVILPIYSFLELANGLSFKKIAVIAIVINLCDIVGNMLGLWENTLVSRLVLGCLLGSTSALLLTGNFFNMNTKTTEDHHGRLRAEIK
jgi:uncharacterized membrane protein